MLTDFVEDATMAMLKYIFNRDMIAFLHCNKEERVWEEFKCDNKLKL